MIKLIVGTATGVNRAEAETSGVICLPIRERIGGGESLRRLNTKRSKIWQN